MAPPLAHVAGGHPQAKFLIEVLPVGVPLELDQSPMVVRQGRSGAAVLDGERWVSPLGDEVRSALSSELAALLSTRDVTGMAGRSDRPVVRVKVQIRRFDAWTGKQVQLLADWEVGLADTPNRWRVMGTGHFDEVAVGGYTELADADQRAVMELAGRIAKDASTLMHHR
jgi:uncharacterized lipoprotein YmbA